MTTATGTRATRALDQMVNSASSAVFAFGAVLLLPAREFGSISLQLVAMSLSLGLVRTAVFEAALFTRDAQHPRQFAWLMLRAGAITAVVTAAAMVAIGLAIDSVSIRTTIAVSLVGLATLIADGVRYSAITAGEPSTALATDGMWLAATVLWAIIQLAGAEGGFDALAFAYAGSGLLAAAVGAVRLRTPIARIERAPVAALRRQSRYGADFALQTVPAQFVLLIAPAFVGLGGLGLYRAVVTLYQPLITASAAVRIAVLGGHESGDVLAATLARVVAILTAVSSAYAAFALAAIHGTHWLDRGALAEASAVLIAIYGLAEICRVGFQPVLDTARLLNRLRTLIRVRAVQAVVLVAGSIGLGSLLDVEGYAVARLATYALALGFTSRLRSTQPTD